MLTQFDLCSGIGAGFPLAATYLGVFDILGLCECDEFCRDILFKRFPNARIVPDVGIIPTIRDLPTFDMLTASHPCQPFSLEGEQCGAGDERDCFPAVLGAIDHCSPRFFALENVPGLLNCPYAKGLTPIPGHPNNQPGSYFAYILRHLYQSGYDVEWINISSARFAAPWKRERLLLVGFSRGIKFKEQPRPWIEQIGEQLEKEEDSWAKRGVQPGLAGAKFHSPSGLDIPIGVKSGNRVNRSRRMALGNALDPRVAAIALQRVLYLNSLAVT